MDDWDLPFIIHGDVMDGLKQIEAESIQTLSLIHI